MIYLAWFVILFTVLQAIVALVNIIIETRLPVSRSAATPLVSVLIPARNEEDKIAALLGDLQMQDYREIEVVVFNDQSTDGTSGIVNSFCNDDKRFTLIDSGVLPEGWLGKNWGCHSMAALASGEYFLFLDADVRIGKGVIRDAVSFCKKHGLSLITIFPKQLMITSGEKATVPVMNFVLLTLLPLILVRKSPLPSLSAANGQFMFFTSAGYRLLRPHEVMKGKKVEDIEIARYYKTKKCRISCLAGEERVQCRMYGEYREAVNGFSKNVAAYFGNSIILAFLFWLIGSFGFIAVLCALPPAFFIFYAAVIIMTRIIVSAAGHQSIAGNIRYLIPQQLSFALFIYFSFVNKRDKSFLWKGRNIY
jgi:glycosyltransferase involved in cell wall biosynthesis